MPYWIKFQYPFHTQVENMNIGHFYRHGRRKLDIFAEFRNLQKWYLQLEMVYIMENHRQDGFREFFQMRNIPKVTVMEAEKTKNHKKYMKGEF